MVSQVFEDSKDSSIRIDHLADSGFIGRMEEICCLIADTRYHRIPLVNVHGTGCKLMPLDGTLPADG